MDPARVAELIDTKVNQSQNRLLSDLDNLILNRLSNFQQSLNESQKALSDAQVAKIEETHTDNYKRAKAIPAIYYAGYRSTWKPNFKDQDSLASFNRGGSDEREKPGLCFACGKPGHWKVDCQARGIRSEQISESEFIHDNNEKDAISLFESTNDVQCESKPDSNLVPENTKNGEKISPVGKLKQNARKRAEFGASKEIIDIVENAFAHFAR